MIILLNFCHRDAEMARNLLTWIGELGGCPNQDLILQSSITAASNGLAAELELEAQGKFRNVTTRVTDVDDERGWPYSCNNAWLDAVNHIRDRTSRPWLYTPIEDKPQTPQWTAKVNEASKKFTTPWLWLEPDCVPLSPGWADKIEAAHAECLARKKDQKHLLGGEVRFPQHRMSGVAVYPPWVAQFTRGLPYIPNNKAPWDQVLAKDFMPFVQFTPLIQNVWNRVTGDPTTMPTFPDEASLSLIDPQAVLFHRVKDGSLIERLREKKSMDYHVEIQAVREKEGPESVLSKLNVHDAVMQPAREQHMNAGLIARIAELEAQLSSPAKKRGKRMKQRSAAQVKADKERMAKVRAARKVTA